MTEQKQPKSSEQSLSYMAWDVKKTAEALEKINTSLEKIVDFLAQKDSPL